MTSWVRDLNSTHLNKVETIVDNSSDSEAQFDEKKMGEVQAKLRTLNDIFDPHETMNHHTSIHRP